MGEPPRAWYRFLAGATGIPGVRLCQPVTLGHALLCRQFRLAVPPPESIGAGDVALYLAVLSRPWRRSVAVLHSRRGRWLIYWYALFLLSPARRVVSDVQVRRNFAAALVGRGCWIAERWSTGGDPVLLVLRTLTECFGYSPDCAMSLPLARALREVTRYLSDAGSAGEIRRAETPQHA